MNKSIIIFFKCFPISKYKVNYTSNLDINDFFFCLKFKFKFNIYKGIQTNSTGNVVHAFFLSPLSLRNKPMKC